MIEFCCKTHLHSLIEFNFNFYFLSYSYFSLFLLFQDIAYRSHLSILARMGGKDKIQVLRDPRTNTAHWESTVGECLKVTYRLIYNAMTIIIIYYISTPMD